MKKNIFNKIYDLIVEYEQKVGRNPFIIILNHKTYDELIKELSNITNGKYQIKHDNGINYIFGIPFELSNYLIHDAICMDEIDYRKYCGEKYEQIF